MASTRVKINGRWVDVPDRPNGVRASIRRNNGGFLASEISIGSIPGGQATVRPGPYMDKKQVGRYRRIPQGNGMSLRKHWVEKDVPVARDKNGRPIPMPANPSSLGGNPIGGFGTPGAAQGRMANGSPILGALPAYMPYDKRFPGTQNWLRETFGKEASRALDGAIKKLDPRTTVTVTGEGSTGVKISRRSSMAVEPGSSTSIYPWDVIRAGIHNQAVQQAIQQASPDNPIYGQGIDLMDKDDIASKSKTFAEQVTLNKEANASHVVDNIVKTIQDDVNKNWKPSTPTAAQTAEANARAKVGTGSTPEERKGNLDTWNAARQTAHAEEAKRHEGSMKYLDDTQKWMKDLAKQHGLKDPTRSAAKGGSAHALPVSRSEDRFLDDLIGEMEV